MLSDAVLNNIRSKGVWVFEYPTHYLLLKNPEAGGNSLNNLPAAVVAVFTGEMLSECKEYRSDCPQLGLLFEEGKYLLQCVNWTPGPGPGDFDLSFDTPEAAVEYALNYFFEKNPHFEALLAWHLAHS
ncbi:MAG: hypothetical protein IM638_09985 [Bacteroidetes bacterium]|nr:hypothetical protein [Bacteroidota bacterium]